MRHRLLESIDRRSAPAILLGCLVVVGLLALIDYRIGWMVDLTAMYLIPVAVAAWRTGFGGGLLLAGSAAAAGTAANVLAGPPGAPVIVWAVALVLDGAILAAPGALIVLLKRTRTSKQRMRFTDPLTGLSTSDAFYDGAGRQVKTAVRYNRPVTLAYIGVDNFNELNERFGHRTGDEVLVSIARTLRQILRETDIVARIGGDEFGVLLPETGAEAGRSAVEKLRLQLVDATEGWPISFSIGAVTCDRTACTLDELIRGAEGLMREVKSGGRNACRVESLEPEPIGGLDSGRESTRAGAATGRRLT